ncbi:thioester-containing protein 1 allele S3-like [Anopheles marshallii]|uniref:thioester-containing protein 1 allele S3-like n=1 Tax=Anopheles marshallii TaxID=1521116 RepID=UPI00237A92AC|nr:thioester-containing protein 1 allele S3-like [Anopheles marshallii]
MWQFIRSHILTVLIFIGAAHGILVVGPRTIRANQDYTVVISNFNLNMSKVDVMLRITGHSDNRTNILDLTKTVEVRRHMNRMITFNMPVDLSAGNYKITIDGQRGFSFHKEAELVHLSKTITGLIQIDKPVYKPGDTVNFRVIVLDSELKPPARVKSIHVTISDPQKNVIRKWSTAKLYAGVFESDLQIAPTPMLGMWNISVKIDGEEIVSKTFEMKEYVLSSFDVEVVPYVVPLEKDQSLTLQIEANYHFGKPVKGVAKFEVYLRNGFLDQKHQFEVNGKRQVELRFKNYFEVLADRQDVLVKTTFIEQTTNRTVVKQSHITVYKYKYGVQLIKDSPQFRPGLPFKCALQFRYHDGTPAKGITGNVEVSDIDYGTTATSDDGGVIKLELNPSDNIDVMNINFSDDDNGFFFGAVVEKVDVVTNAYLKLELRSPVKLNRMLRLTVTCNERMTFFLYYVVTKGNIIDSGYMRPNKQNKYPLQLNATEKMIPKAKLIVATVASSVIVFDYADADFQDLRNNFNFKINKNQLRSGEELQLNMNGRAGAYVALAAYDKSLLQFSTKHDIFWQDIVDIFSEFHTKRWNDFDFFHSMALFARTVEHIRFDEAGSTTSRTGTQKKLDSFRTNFVESWLWKTTTLSASGSATMKEIVPDTTTAWQLTGFSVHPEYGLGIIKQPVELTTVQEFYIVEQLPYSIKRGEVAALQFIIFSNFPQKYQASVTLYNVDNQTEFVGQPAGDTSYTKSVQVSPDTGVAVSFPIKARKLGEMTIRVKASIDPATDTIESVIRVIPESLVKREMVSRFFCHNTYHNQSFSISLDFDMKADPGHKKIDFILTPNILTSVMDNLESLLSVPTGCGEQNMMRLVPIVQVLDYMTSIGSANKPLTDKATGLLKAGYQNQIRFRQPDGSFGLWEKSGGGLFLTAFVGKTLATAAKYISEIEPNMVMKTYDWLSARQHATGRFDEVGPIFHKDMQGGLRQGIALTSFVLISFLEYPKAATKHAAVIAKGIKYVTSTLHNIEDSYDLAIATYALMLQGHSTRDQFLEKLIGMSTVQHNGTERFWQRNANGIETTAYALLSFVLAEKYVDGTSIMRWLVKQRYTPGSFPRTQDTFVGLKALTKLAEKISPSRNDYSVQLVHSGRQKEFRVNSQDIGNLQHAEGVDDSLQMQINVAGIGFGLLQVAYEYSIDLRNFTNSFKLELNKSLTNNGKRLELEVCSSFIPKLSDGRSNMALVEVNFPSGYTTERNLISDTTKYNPVQKIEIRFGGTSVVVYYNNMGTERNCFEIIALRQTKVALKRPAYVLVHDYYDPKLNAIKMYQVDDHGV